MMHEQLPSGKTIFRRFNADGELTRETHAYGALEIALEINFTKGTRTGETYFVKKRLVARARYEQARKNFSDMPPADPLLEDTSGELVKAVAHERRERQQAARARKPDPEKGHQIDTFCLATMKRGKREDAVSWIESSRNSLGELSHAASRRLVAKLLRLGCKQIHACEIDDYDEGCNTGHVVVELPSEAERRKAILRELDRLASDQGYAGDFDDGQHYAYIKLD